MARYGRIFRYPMKKKIVKESMDFIVYLFVRGNKAENAAVAGCSGLIIFMDPSTVAMLVIHHFTIGSILPGVPFI